MICRLFSLRKLTRIGIPRFAHNAAPVARANGRVSMRTTTPYYRSIRSLHLLVPMGFLYSVLPQHSSPKSMSASECWWMHAIRRHQPGIQRILSVESRLLRLTRLQVFLTVNR